MAFFSLSFEVLDMTPELVFSWFIRFFAIVVQYRVEKSKKKVRKKVDATLSNTIVCLSCL